MFKEVRSWTSRQWVKKLTVLLIWAITLGVVMAALVGASTLLGISPKPAVMVIRYAFNRGGDAMSTALAKFVPPHVAAILNEHYDPTDSDAYLDVFHPLQSKGTATLLPVIVWVHGGGWIAGDKSQVANYLQILADKGYAVVGVNYSIAPQKTYPTPIGQVNTALAYLQANASRLHVDTSRIYLAGDSAGAHIAAQLANIVSVPSYASRVAIQPTIKREQLRGVILYCGAYDAKLVRFDGLIGVFMKTVLWSYSGTKDFRDDPQFSSASVIDFLTPAFPPTFISVGNRDPLAPQSHAMAQALQKQGVQVDSLFFSESHPARLPHEYQFNFDKGMGEKALERSLAFMARQ